MLTALEKYNRGRVLVFVMGAFLFIGGPLNVRGIVAYEPFTFAIVMRVSCVPNRR